MLIARARYIELTGQLDAARAAFERALAVDPASPVALVALVALDVRQRDGAAIMRDAARLEPVVSSAAELAVVSTRCT